MALTWKKLAFDDDLTTHTGNTTTAHGAVSAATASKIIVRDASARAKVAAPSAEDDIALKSNVTTVNTALTTHGDLTTAHGAVSAATASKMVVRDASARTKFAAPGAAGDALIKGTALTITEMAALTTGKIWQGVANRPSEVAMPVAPKIVTGSYTGNGAAARQITTGFKCSLVKILHQISTDENEWTLIPSRTIEHQYGNVGHAEDVVKCFLHATDGFVVDNAGAGVYTSNRNTETYYYWAISQ